jgi:hypothetical protein
LLPQPRNDVGDGSRNLGYCRKLENCPLDGFHGRSALRRRCRALCDALERSPLRAVAPSSLRFFAEGRFRE